MSETPVAPFLIRWWGLPPSVRSKIRELFMVSLFPGAHHHEEFLNVVIQHFEVCARQGVLVPHLERRDDFIVVHVLITVYILDIRGLDAFLTKKAAGSKLHFCHLDDQFGIQVHIKYSIITLIALSHAGVWSKNSSILSRCPCVSR